MSNRIRKNQIHFMCDDEEYKKIINKYKYSQLTNISHFIRKMILEGYIINLDLTSLKERNVEINKIGTNINQIAKKVNMTDELTKKDTEIIIEYLKEIKKYQIEILKEFSDNFI